MLRSRLILVFAVVLYVCCFFVGCKTVADAVDSYKVCKANAACFAEMEKGRTLAESLAVVVASGVPVPVVMVLLSLLVLLLVCWFPFSSEYFAVGNIKGGNYGFLEYWCF